MKTILFILINFLASSQLTAQSRYIYGQITKGKNASYYCIKRNEYRLLIVNTNNKDTTYTIYYNDGSILPENADVAASNLTDDAELYNALRSILTDDEWTTLKKMRMGLIIFIVSDNQGNTSEISFDFDPADPVMTKMDPDRLFLLEKKFKDIIKIDPDNTIRTIRNFKFTMSILYPELP